MRFRRNARTASVARHRAGTQRAKEIGLVLDDGAVRLLGRGERKPRDTGRVVDGKLPEKGRMIGDPKKKVAKGSFVEMLQEGGRLRLVAHAAR